MDSNETLVNSFSVLVHSLNNHANDLKDASELKNTSAGVDHEQLVALEQRIRIIERTFKTIRARCQEEKQQIDAVQNLRTVVGEQTALIQSICGNLPQHLPQQINVASVSQPVQESVKENVPKSVDVNTTKNAKSVPGTKPRRKGRNKTKYTDRIPRLKFLTVDEFSAVPGFIRGRLSLNKVRCHNHSHNCNTAP